MKHIRFGALTLALAACGGATTSSEGPPNRIIAQNLVIENGAPLRFGIAPSEPFAHVLTNFTPASGGLMVCPLPSLDAPLPPRATCRTDIGAGVRETVTAPGLRAVALVATRGSLAADVTVEFSGPSRAISAVIGSVPPPVGACEDVDCSPLIEVSPGRDGPLTARATWSGPAATLELLQGRILARSMTANPDLPYREEARTDGASPLSLEARLSRTGEYALILRQAPDAAAMTAVRIEAVWP